MIKEIDMQSWFEQALPNPIKWEGAEGRTLCPWHDDKNPSLFVNRFTGKFYCHGCNVGGGLRKFSQMTKTDLPNAGKVRFIPNQNPKGAVRRSILKTKTHEREHIYLDEHGRGIHLIGVDGTGGEKKVTQYRIRGPGIWFTGSPKQRVPYNLPIIMKAIHEDETIFVVEGEKDVDTLTKFGVVATTNPNGALKWPDDEEFNKHFYDADVVIIPDNDQVGHDHAKHVGAILQSIAATVRVLALPGVSEKGDVTDWVNLGGDPKALRQMADLSGMRLQVENQKNENSKVPTFVPPAESCKPGKSNAKKQEEYFDARGGFQPVTLATDVRDALPMKYYRGDFYVYENGYYQSDAKWKVEQYCQRVLGNHSRSRYIREVVEWLKNDRRISDEVPAIPDDGLINVANGLLNWQAGELLEHTPTRFCTVQIPVQYNPAATAHKVQQFVADVVPSDVVPAVWQLFGYCLIPSTKYTAAFLLTGEGANGKSTFIKLLEAFLGKRNVSKVTRHDLETNRFSVAVLRDKLANSVSDMAYTALDSSQKFKEITSGDPMPAEFKGKDMFDFVPFARFVIAANEPPATCHFHTFAAGGCFPSRTNSETSLVLKREIRT